MTRGPLPLLDISSLSNSADLNLPDGWVVKERKRSLVEVETNIRTLGQLYRTLSDLKKQLPSPIAAAVENDYKASLPRRQSSLDTYITSFHHSRNNSDRIPVTPVDSLQNSAVHQNSLTPSTAKMQALDDDPVVSARRFILSKYPAVIFEPLIELHLSCSTSCPSWRDPVQFMATYRDGQLLPALMYAIFAHSALHGLMCHPNTFNQPYLLPLAHDCYQLACDLVEFDVMTTSTVEALVTMHLYSSLIPQYNDQQKHDDGSSSSGSSSSSSSDSHLLSTHFWLAKRHVECLDYSKWWGFRAWFRRIELATTNCSGPISSTSSDTRFTLKKPKRRHLHYPHSSSSLPLSPSQSTVSSQSSQTSSFSSQTLPSSDEMSLEDQQQYQQQIWVYYEIKGWELIQQSASVASLQSWIEETMTSMEENDSMAVTPTPLWQKLRLQTLYLAGILNRYQADMMAVFANDERWLLDDQVTDYFSVPLTTQNRIEQHLHNSMLAAYKLIQVIISSFNINHRCLLPELMTMISAACTILYFGHKVTSDPAVTQQAEQALGDLVNIFENEYGMLQIPCIYSSVVRWKSMVDSFGKKNTR